MKVKKGQTVLIRTRSNGAGRLEKAAETVQPIVGLYMNGNVKVNTGDVWAITPWGGPEADFLAVS